MGSRVHIRALIVLAAAAALLGTSAPAEGEQAASVQARAEAVMAQIDRLDAQRADAAAAEQDAHRRMQAVEAALDRTAQRIEVANRNLSAAEQSLADLLVSSYKSGPTDAASYLFASESFGDLMDRLAVVDRMAEQRGDLIREIGDVRRELERSQADQEAELRVARATLAEARAAGIALDRATAERRAVLAGLTARIADLVHREQDRRTSLAEAHPTGGGGTQTAQEVFYGEATWYGDAVAGNLTASGEVFDPDKLTCASPWLPFGTMLRVTLLSSGRSVVVRVNDRGPFGGGVIDLSQRAAEVVGLLTIGRGRVRVAEF
jgi:rare lipoprotein A